jgi:hypothetical protein
LKVRVGRLQADKRTLIIDTAADWCYYSHSIRNCQLTQANSRRFRVQSWIATVIATLGCSILCAILAASVQRSSCLGHQQAITEVSLGTDVCPSHEDTLKASDDSHHATSRVSSSVAHVAEAVPEFWDCNEILGRSDICIATTSMLAEASLLLALCTVSLGNLRSFIINHVTPTFQGMGDSTFSLHPSDLLALLQETKLRNRIVLKCGFDSYRKYTRAHLAMRNNRGRVLYGISTYAKQAYNPGWLDRTLQKTFEPERLNQSVSQVIAVTSLVETMNFGDSLGFHIAKLRTYDEVLASMVSDVQALSSDQASRRNATLLHYLEQEFVRSTSTLITF